MSATRFVARSLVDPFGKRGGLWVCFSRGSFHGARHRHFTRPVLVTRYRYEPWYITKLTPANITALHVKWYSNTEINKGEVEKEKSTTSRKETRSNLAKVLREYGTVAVVFHLTMSLSVLSVCYLVVKSGVDVESFLKYFKIDASRYSTASTFAVSYIIYKILLPIRATVTITSVPFIVRYLRAKGIMKPPISTTKQ